jgi:pimeloyl-ACP methyl ester carboxylesterase
MSNRIQKLLTAAIVATTIVALIPILIPTFAAADGDGWTLVTDGKSVSAYPSMREYVWQKNATMAPNGPYDKIGLHRLVQPATPSKGAILILSQMYGSGEQLIANLPNGTATESNGQPISQPMYWANRGFDVYAIDYRSHFIPQNLNASQLDFAASWGYDQYMNDIKEAVEKIKTLSGASKIFIVGESIGGQYAMYYASKYWRTDLKGIILLDTLENTAKTPNPKNNLNLTRTLALSFAAGIYSLEVPSQSGSISPSGMLFVYQNAYQHPDAPAQMPNGTLLTPTVNPATNKTWSNITGWLSYSLAVSQTCNFNGGYADITANAQFLAASDRYYPARLGIESLAVKNWTNCPYLTYDFDDHYSEIDVPLLGFRSGLFGIPALGNYTNGLATRDFTQITLPNYGHRDVWMGTHTAQDVSQPIYQWMVNHTVVTLAASNLNPSPDQTITLSLTSNDLPSSANVALVAYVNGVEQARWTTTLPSTATFYPALIGANVTWQAVANGMPSNTITTITATSPSTPTQVTISANAVNKPAGIVQFTVSVNSSIAAMATLTAYSGTPGNSGTSTLGSWSLPISNGAGNVQLIPSALSSGTVIWQANVNGVKSNTFSTPITND